MKICESFFGKKELATFSLECNYGNYEETSRRMSEIRNNQITNMQESDIDYDL